MAVRRALFVGSYPASNTHQAMHEMLTFAATAGVQLVALPDGETGERGAWVRDKFTILEQGHPALRLAETAKGKNYTSWDDVPSLEVVDEAGFTADSLRVRFGYAYEANLAQLVLNDLRELGLGQDVVLQVGMPAPLDMALAVLGPAGLPYVELFQEALLGHIRDVQTLAGDTIVQLEMPVTLNLANSANPHMPAELQPEALSASVTDTAARAPDGTTFGLHLCFGDLNNEGRVDQAVARPSVTFTEMVVGSWPAGRSLAYVHIPLASGHVPPPLEPDIYAPLGELAAAVPPDVRIVAGIAHEAQSLDEQEKVLGLVEDALGRPTDVAAACGLGRRTLSNARAVAQRTMDLARTPV